MCDIFNRINRETYARPLPSVDSRETGTFQLWLTPPQPEGGERLTILSTGDPHFGGRGYRSRPNRQPKAGKSCLDWEAAS
jgi:hypothetical protein